MFDMRPILLANGILLGLLSVVMLIPMTLDLIINSPDWLVFAESAFITAFVGGILFFSNRGYKGSFGLRQAFLFTSTSYVIVSSFAALPFYIGDFDMRPVDAFFEATSGITTTGSTVMVGLDHLPPGLLLWRSLLQAIGGVGIVVLGLAILPLLQIGGMQLFRTESSDTGEKILPRVTQISSVISLVFLCLTLLCALAYYWAGMNGFDAVNHAMTTIATSGFSTHDESFGFYTQPAILWAAAFFMVLSACPMILYYQMVRGKPLALWQSSQVRWFISTIILAIIILTSWMVIERETPLHEAIRHVSFNVISIITTTGYSSENYGGWGSFAVCLFFMLSVVGGCTGSTAGGIKIFRFQILYQTANAQVNRLIHPHGVFVPRYNQKPISDSVATSVTTFIILFGLSFTILALLLSLYGLDFLTSMSAAAQALANVGPGLGKIIGPTGNYNTLPDGAKWLLSLAMIMGRLELLTVLILLSRHFWRD